MIKLKIPILMYHSIESMPKSTNMRSLHVPPRKFRFQMWLLKVMGYKGLSVRQLNPYLNGEKKGKVVGITFDDGYRNNLTNAAAILKKYDFSATCFIVSENIGSTNTWDIDKGITQRPLMNKDEIHHWLKFGMDIGAHTKSHVDLTSVSEKRAKQEMCDCKTQLENFFNIEVTDFCYPFGRFNKALSGIVKDSGYKTASSMQRGRATSESDLYILPRIPINYRTLPHLFLLKILTKYEDIRKDK